MPPMTDDLRIHAAAEPAPRHGGEHVLYWMQSTFRTRDNHALDFAIEQANRLGLPLLVYHGLRHDYPWASDRLHTFLLESVADLYAEFDELGIQYAFYLERDGDDASQEGRRDGRRRWCPRPPRGARGDGLLPHFPRAEADPCASPESGDARDRGGLRYGGADPIPRAGVSHRRAVSPPAHGGAAALPPPLAQPGAEGAAPGRPAVRADGPGWRDPRTWWPRATSITPSLPRRVSAAGRRPHGSSWSASWRPVCLAMRRSAATPTPMPPADCRPTSTSATSRRWRWCCGPGRRGRPSSSPSSRTRSSPGGSWRSTSPTSTRGIGRSRPFPTGRGASSHRRIGRSPGALHRRGTGAGTDRPSRSGTPPRRRTSGTGGCRIRCECCGESR